MLFRSSCRKTTFPFRKTPESRLKSPAASEKAKPTPGTPPLGDPLLNPMIWLRKRARKALLPHSRKPIHRKKTPRPETCPTCPLETMISVGYRGKTPRRRKPLPLWKPAFFWALPPCFCFSACFSRNFTDNGARTADITSNKE